MGNVVRKAMSTAKKPLRNFNVEDRAHKIVSKDKPIAAPRHKIDQTEYERVMKEYPDVYEQSLQKNKQLDEHLKDVFVRSHDSVLPKPSVNPEKPLPLDRQQVSDFEYGMKDPEKVRLGKATLKQALKFLTDHQADPKLHTKEKIAADYSVPVESITNILKYYKIFEVYIPEQRKVKAKFAGPSVPRIKISVNPRKQLAAGKAGKEET